MLKLRFIAVLVGFMVTMTACGEAIWAPDPGDPPASADGSIPSSPPAPSGNGIKAMNLGYVVDLLRLPLGLRTEDRFQLQTPSGARHNQLGSLLNHLHQTGLLGDDLQQRQDHAVCSGVTPMLLQVRADSKRDDRKLQGRAWIGRQVSCCKQPSCVDPRHLTRCDEETKARCFAGTGVFWPKTETQSAIIPGVAINHWISLGPQTIPLALTLPGAGTIVVKLHGATIRGRLAQGRIIKGQINGGIHEVEVERVLCPALAKMLYHRYLTTSDAGIKGGVKMFLDSNNDGQVTDSMPNEVICNAKLQQFLVTTDWDRDGDGYNELFSVGFGFSAFKATIPIDY